MHNDQEDGMDQLLQRAMRADVPFELDLRAKQLYHDREEITVFATRA